MDQKQLQQIFLDTDFVHWSGTPEELKVAEYLKAKCEELGVPAHLESFRVASADIESARVLADAGVYKHTPEGDAGVMRFLESIGYKAR